jgi:hypothetical protein
MRAKLPSKRCATTGNQGGYEQNGPYLTAMIHPDIATSSAGVAFIRDIDNVAAFPSMTDLALEYRIGTAALPLQTKVAQDFVTWVTGPGAVSSPATAHSGYWPPTVTGQRPANVSRLCVVGPLLPVSIRDHPLMVVSRS